MKLKYGFVTTIKGGIIGIGSAIPFISLGALLASIDLFELIVDAICNFFKDVKKNTFILVPLIIGIVIGTYSSIFVTGPIWAIWKDAGVSAKKKAKAA